MTYKDLLRDVVMSGLVLFLFCLLVMLVLFFWNTRPWK